MSDTYVVAYEDIDKPFVRKFAEVDAAENFLDKQPESVTGFVVEEAEDLEDASPIVLTTIYNTVAKKKDPKFASSEEGAEKVFPLLDQAVKALKPAKSAAKAKSATEPKERKPRTLKAIDLPVAGGWDKIKKYRKGSRADIMVGKLSRKNGASLEEIAEALSNDKTDVDISTARSWLSYLHTQNGYGIRSEEKNGVIRCFLIQPEGERPADPEPAEKKAKPKKDKAKAKEAEESEAEEGNGAEDEGGDEAEAAE